MRRLGRILLGFLAVTGLVALTLIGLSIWAVTRIQEAVEPALPQRMVLAVDLDAEFRESPHSDPLARLRGDKVYVMRRVVAAIDHAATDERVVGLFGTLGQVELGMAAAQEIRDAVTRFRASGKPAVLFAETIGEFGNGTVDYYLASSFGEVWLQPSGDVGLTGFLVESPFLKGTLDLLGIDTQFVARHEYKGAIEVLTEKGFTPEHRETVGGLLDSWMTQVVEGVAAARNLPPEAVRALIGNGPLLPNEALSAGLVDRLGYHDEAWAAANAQAQRPDRVDVADYARSLPTGNGPRVALITGTGAIQRGESGSPFGADGFGSHDVAEAFRDAIDDPRIRAILFRVDSPGGSYVASDTVWHEVRRARAAGKPVVVSMAGMAASGGYFVSMAADRVVAQPGTVTGSIGVFSGKVVLEEFWDKIGVSWDELHRGDNATMFSLNRPFSEQEWNRMNILVDRIYEDFTTKAALGRNIDPKRMDQLARGRIWSGADAHRLGLVDRLGGFDVAVAELSGLLELAPDESIDLRVLPEEREPWQVLAGMLGGGMDQPELRALARIARVLEPIAAHLEGARASGELRMAPLVRSP